MSSRLSLTPRAALLLAAVVAVVAVLVIVLGTRSTGDGPSAEVVVSDAPSTGPSTAAGTSTVGASPAGTGPASGATPSMVVVHVAGAVAEPGVVTLPAGSRVETALERAGGAARDADLARVNLARPLVDGEQVYVPRVGETEIPAAVPEGGAGGLGSAGASGPAGASGSTGADAVVDLNAADAATLETLPGIGPALAERILAWREEHGRFATVEDLLDISGIGDAKFADLQPRVRV